MTWIVLVCPVCHQEIEVWPGVEATCTGGDRSHRRCRMRSSIEESA